MRSLKRILASAIVFMMVFSCSLTAAFADEVEGEITDGEEAGEEGEEAGEEGMEDGELSPEEALAALETVTPSSITTNIDGKYLALSFPASELPKGFAVKTVDYQGEQVMLAYITAKSSVIGAEGLTVHLAYLTDENGQDGEFYLCDTTENARMSDMIKIDGAEDRFIIVLDPGDNVVGPVGFVQHKLQWGKKTAVAWSLPEDTAEEEDKDKKKDGKDKEEKEEKEPEKDASLFSVYAYADELHLSAGEAVASPSGGGSVLPGDSDTEDSFKADTQEGDDSANEDAMLALDAIAHTNAAGLIQAQPKEFCLLYAIDESGNLGFYLYDIERGTYQRYVDIPKGESATLIKYRKLSRTRLFIIIVLVIILVIMTIILVNTLLNRRGGAYEDEEDPEEEAMRKRAKDKERRSIGRREGAYLLDEEESREDDFEDDYDEEEDGEDGDEEDEEEYEERERNENRIRRRSVTKGRQEPQRRAAAELSAASRDTSDVDWEHMEITAGLNPGKTREALNRKSAPRADLDEDFDFEFLNIKDRK